MRNETRALDTKKYNVERNPTKDIEKTPISFSNAIKTGLVGGLVMIGYLLLVELLFSGDLLGIKFLKYLVLAIPMAVGISKLKDRMKNKYRFFQKGIAHSAVVSATAAVVMMLAYFITIPFDNYTLATITTSMASLNTSTSNFMVPFLSSMMLFMEVFVMSMITSFAIILYKYDYARTA